MGVVMSLIPYQQKYSKNPDYYWVHGIHYWPGEAVPYRKWNELLPDYAFPDKWHGSGRPQVDTEQVALSVEERDKTRPSQSGSRSGGEWLSKLERLRLQNMRLLRGQRNKEKCSGREKGEGHLETKGESVSVLSGQECGSTDRDSSICDRTTQLSHCERVSDIVSDNVPKMSKTLDCDGASRKGSDSLFPSDDKWKSGSYPFENLVLSGGGMKGYAYIGAIKVKCLNAKYFCLLLD